VGGGSGFFNANTLAWNIQGVTHASPFSLECWVWLHEGTSPAQQLIFGHVAALVIAANGHAQFYDGTLQPGDPAVLSVNAWHHLVGTYGPGGSKLYVDAFNVVTAAYSGVVAPVVAGVSIGGQVPTATIYGHGNIAECAIYNAELTAGQVTTHFVAADNTASRPVYRAEGTWNITTGQSVTTPEKVDALVADVTKNLGNTP
jgi:hypothetical protein